MAAALVLLLVCLFYLQFGLQALAHHVPQGVLSLVGALALGLGAVGAARRRTAALTVFLGTLPVLLLHAAMFLDDAGELPFLIGSVPAPTIAGVTWLWRRRSSAARPA
jgi:hypothetical protein